MPAESPVGLSSVHARANIREPRTTASRQNVRANAKKKDAQTIFRQRHILTYDRRNFEF